MYRFILGCAVLIILGIQDVSAQGPPITGDKPIMVGQGRKIIKTLTTIGNYDQGTYVRVPLMIHYLPTANTLVALHTPFVSGPDDSGLGDVQILAKYQFFRKDMVGKTLRMVLKTTQSFPTGKEYDIPDVSIGQYQAGYGVVVGYETIKYGIGGELRYRQITGGFSDEINFKLGFGLPLFKPVYPVNQLNLYFEYLTEYLTGPEEFNIKYSSGIQYAKNQLTFEMAYQTTLRQAFDDGYNYVFFLGTRYIF